MKQATVKDMELGNLVFGHSRGNYVIPRTDSWGDSMWELQEKIQKGCSPYGAEFENDVFAMHAYYWGDCSCGYDKKEYEWCEKNKHSLGCWQFIYRGLEERFGDGAWMDNNVNHKEYTVTLNRLLKEYGLPRQGYAVHCTCTYREKWAKFCERNEHKSDCGVVRPNFLYKPSGFEVRWYKFALRDSYSSNKITLVKWMEMLNHCKKSLSKFPLERAGKA